MTLGAFFSTAAFLALVIPTSSAATPAGKALNFDGGDHVLIPHSSSLNFSGDSSFTIELWFKHNGSRGVYHILGKRQSCSHSQLNYQIARDFSSLLSFISDGDVVGTGYDPPPNVWTHVAVTYAPHLLRMYVNGVLEATTPYTVTAETTAPLLIGDSGGCPAGQRFPGQIDEVRIWRTARSTADIACDYNRAVPSNTPGLIGYWNFDDILGQVVPDLSPYHNDGVLGSDAAVTAEDPAPVASTAPLVDVDHDAALLSLAGLDVPLILGSTIVPTIAIQNRGVQSDSVVTRLTIGALYDEVVTAFLAPGERLDLQFPAWTANLEGSFMVRGTVFVGGDVCSANDSSGRVVAVYADPSNPTILSASPQIGGDQGQVTVALTGTQFVQGAAVSLEMGDSVVVANPVVADPDGRSLSARFDLTAHPHGAWDIVVTNPGGATARFSQAFAIQALRSPAIRVDILGRKAIRAGLAQSYPVLCTNLGNVESPVAALWIRGIPTNATVQVDLGPAASPFPVTSGEPLPNPEIVELPGEKFVAVVIEPLAAGTTTALTLTVTIPTQQTIELEAWAWAIASDDVVSSVNAHKGVLERSTAIPCTCAGDEAGVASALDIATLRLFYGWVGFNVIQLHRLCVGAADDLASHIADAANDPSSPLYRWGIETVDGSGLHNAVRLTSPAQCHYLIDNYINARVDLCRMDSDGHRIASFCGFGCPIQKWMYWTRLQIYTPPPAQAVGKRDEGAVSLSGSAAQCLLPTLSGSLSVDVVGSIDPNDKSGPTGFGAARYVRGGSQLPYMIQFENKSGASAAARDVVITDHLDPAVFDLSTLSFGPVVIAGRQFVPPAGSKAIAADLDLRPAHAAIARFQAGVSPGSGVVTWSMTTIDPNTGLPPDDPTVGFLRPNVTPPEGEGSVSILIGARAELATGSLVPNDAAIRFDANPIIMTPLWSNTLDASLPQSAVVVATPIANDSVFVIEWSGRDAGSGIRDYSVYVAEGGGPYGGWVAHTPVVQDTFYGRSNTSYRFYSVARDSVGNVEDPPSVADLTITTTTDVPHPRGPFQLALDGVRPNPSTRGFVIALSLPGRGDAMLEVLDIAGRRVLSRPVGEFGPGHHFVDLAPARGLVQGVYLVRLSAGGRSITKRAVVLGR